MAITSIKRDWGTEPAIVRISSTDDYATISATGYLTAQMSNIQTVNSGDFQWDPSDMICCWYVNDSLVLSWAFFTISTDQTSLIPFSSPGVASITVNSATPGTVRAFMGKVTQLSSTMTSGNLVGVRGEVDFVSDSTSAYVYGVQGKVIPTGTVGSGQFNAAVFGQFDIHAATINGGQMATLWGDYGTTSGTLTSQTGLYGIAMTNTTAAVLEGQLYLYGGATNLMLLNTNAGLSGTTYFQAAGTGSGSWGYGSYAAATEVLQINVNGTNYWIPCKSSNS